MRLAELSLHGPGSPAERSQEFHVLNFQFRSLFLRTRNPQALEQAIYYGQLAVQETTKDNPELARRRHDLGICHGDRFELNGNMADLTEAINLGHLALRDLSENHADRPAILAYLCAKIGDRFVTMGNLEDAYEAIGFGELALNSPLAESDRRSEHLHNLSACYGDLFTRTGELKHIEEAIRLQQLASDAIPQNHPDRTLAMHDLAVCFRHRYLRMQNLEDIQQAIRLEQSALESDVPGEFFSRAESLCNLALCLADRYSRKRDMGDMDEAIRLVRSALSLSCATPAEKADCYDMLCLSFHQRFSTTKNKGDMELAIHHAEEALAMTPDHSPFRLKRLHNLSACYVNLAKVSTPMDINVINKAIRLENIALQADQGEHPHMVECLCVLGQCFLARAEISGSVADIEESIKYSIRSLQHANGLHLTRMRSGILAASCLAMLTRWSDSAAVFEESFNLLPMVSPRTSAKKDLEDTLKRLAGAVPLAASVFLKAGKSPTEALQVLERGRGVIDSLVIDTRSDVSALKDQHKNLYSQFVELRDVVALSLQGSVGDSSGKDTSGHYTLETLRRSKAASDLNNLIQEIRQKPEFETFLGVQTENEIRQLAASGPVVYYNISNISAEAFLVTKDTVDCLQLPGLEDIRLDNDPWLLSSSRGLESDRLPASSRGRWGQRDAKLISNPEGSMKKFKIPVKAIGDLQKEMLFIWENAVKPVLAKLSLLEQKDLQSPLPRVWWIGGGLVTKIPLHAAGIHSPGSTENTLSHVVSSYATTLKSLQYARDKNKRRAIPQTHRVLVIAMAETPGFPGKLEVESEVTAIVEAVGVVQSKVKILRQPSKGDVLREFPDCTICHFACHAKADPEEPGSSALCLGQDTLEELSVADLDTIKHPDAQIAYLSACSTAEMKVHDLFNENIHLANAFLIAGFPHVIGTLWKADDSAAIEVAGEFYKCLVKGDGAGDESVAVALHKAVLRLRNSVDNNEKIWKWAPFIHLGV